MPWGGVQFNCQTPLKLSLALTDGEKRGGGPDGEPLVRRHCTRILRERRPRYGIFPTSALAGSPRKLCLYRPGFREEQKGTWTNTVADHALYGVRGVWSWSDFISLSSSHPVSTVCRKVLIDSCGRLQAIMHQRQSREGRPRTTCLVFSRGSVIA